VFLYSCVFERAAAAEVVSYSAAGPLAFAAAEPPAGGGATARTALSTPLLSVSFAEADGGAPIAVEGLAQPFVLVLNVSAREQQMHLRNRSGVQGAHSIPLGLFLRTLHTVFVAYSECLPARLNRPG
jgi:hypothetical protein